MLYFLSGIKIVDSSTVYRKAQRYNPLYPPKIQAGPDTCARA